MHRQGAAYVFERDSSNAWVEMQKLVPSDAEDAYLWPFGLSIALAGSWAIIGAPDYGAAYAFSRDSSGTWVETQKLVPSQGVGYFGSSAGIWGDRAVLGAAGGAFVFERDTTGTWPAVRAWRTIQGLT